MEVSSPPDLVGGSQTEGEVESSDTAVSITTEQVIPEGYLRGTPTSGATKASSSQLQL